MEEATDTLDAHNIQEVFMKCLFESHEVNGREIPEDAVKAEGIQRTFYFHPGRLNENQDNIKKFINQLPDVFEEGYTFLDMPMTKSGVQWGEHRNCEQLLVLGIALDLMEYVMPRELWSSLPGGMPYVIVKGGN